MTKKIVSVLFLSLFILIALVGCGATDSSTGNEGNKENNGDEKSNNEILIGITQNNVGIDSYQTTYENAFKDHAEDLGVRTIVLDAGGDVARQINQMEDLIQQNVDVIIVWPVNGKAIVPAARNAKEAGIPVLITNSPIDESGFDMVSGYTGPDNVLQGKLAAEMMIEALGGKGKVVEIMGLPGYVTSAERSQGFREEIEQNSEIEIIETQPGDWNREKGQRVMEDFLTKYREIDGVYSANDDMAAGAINALKESGRLEDVKITSSTLFAVGYDAIKRGELYGSVQQSPVEDAKLALETAIDIALGKEVPFFNYFETPKVTEENIDQFEKPIF